MENFITGYPGHEHEMRRALKAVLGPEKYEYFFERFLTYFFDEADAAFFASLGLNCLRLPVNYRHFEDDMNPRVFREEGLRHLDRVVDLCARHGIYTIIDLHAAPGGQNVDWHSDSGIAKALFWDHKDFQDRTVLIWEKLAQHYKDNPWVAGYNPLNEPTDVEHTRLLAFYERVEKAIRAIDAEHILFLDGNTFGADFSRFGKPLPNSVYACHDYSNYGFPNPPEPFTRSEKQIATLERQFERKIKYMREIGGPVWNGEFGPVYASPEDGDDYEKTNDERYAVLEEQLKIYARVNASWSIWLYKDIGFQGMVYVDPETPYMKLLKPFLEKKKQTAVDAWGCDDTPVRDVFVPMERWLTESAPGIEKLYPPMWRAHKHLFRRVRNCLLGEVMSDEYAEYFRDKTTEELDELAKSFALANCQKRGRLNHILTEDGKREVHE